MKQIFASSVHIEASPAADIIKRLRRDQLVVLHSPVDDGSIHWVNWYERECLAQLDKSEVFISVITLLGNTRLGFNMKYWKQSGALRKVLCVVRVTSTP
jgi:hypothetical protein